MKTREEVEALKANWLSDPCYDIEDTPGFEEYAVELAGFAIEHREVWRLSRERAAAEAYRNTPASEATLRDEFAMHAMQGDLASQHQSVDDFWATEDFPKLAQRAYAVADAMMAERKRGAS